MLLDVLYLLALLLASPWLLWRRWHTGRYRHGLPERLLGRYRNPRTPPQVPAVWFHGVSLGEVHLLLPLVRAFRQRHPHWRVIVSSTTDSGLEAACRLFPEAVVVPWPFDFTWAVRRAVEHFRPRLVVLAESELWPHFLHAASAAGAAVVVVNARISPRTLARMRRLRPLLGRFLWPAVRHFAVQSPEYAARLRELGVGPDRLTVTGSLKFDGLARHDAAAVERLARLVRLDAARRQRQTVPATTATGIGTHGLLVWVAGSTHPPEEEIVLQTFERLRAKYSQLRLILVPRHPDRFDAAARLVAATGRSWCRRSQLREPLAELPDIVLWDTLGELATVWGLADCGFVGGSLDGHRGGQSMIEPAAHGVPTVFGPHVWNFRGVAEQLIAAGGAVQIADPVQLEAVIERWIVDPALRGRMGQAALQLVRSQQGAVERTLTVLESLLPAVPPAAAGLPAAPAPTAEGYGPTAHRTAA